MKKSGLYLISFILICPYLSAQNKGIIKNYFQLSKSEGLSHNSVTSVCNDIYGRIWIGSFSGLDIYDSQKLHHVDLLQGRQVRNLFNTGKEMLIATIHQLITYNYREGTYRTLKFRDEDIKYITSILYNNNQINIIAAGKVYKYENGKITLQKDGIIEYTFLVADKFGTLWGLKGDTVYQMKSNYTLSSKYKLSNNKQESVVHGRCIYSDANGSIWVGTRKDGLYRYNRAIDSFQKEHIEKKYGIKDIENIGSINEDNYSRLWIGHNSGIAVYDYTNNYLKDYMLENSNGITENTTITHIYKTHTGNLTIGTYFSGAFFIRELVSPFEFYNFLPDRKDARGVAINGIIEDENNRVWIATNRSGINVVDQQGKLLKQINSQTGGINDNIVSMTIDHTGNIWAGSLSDGIFTIDKNGAIQHITSDKSSDLPLSGNEIYVLKTLNRDSLLIGTNKGVDLFSFASKTITPLIPKSNMSYSFINIHTDPDHIYIVDLGSILVFNKHTKRHETYNLAKEYPNTRIQSSYLTNKGSLLLGTNKGELFLFENKKINPFLTGIKYIKSGISGIRMDINGNIWLSSGNNLFCLNPSHEVKKINLEWGMGKNEFNVRSCFSDRNGVIYLGTTDGYVRFNPQKVTDDRTRVPVLYITGLKLLNKTIVANDDSGILKESINDTEKIFLKNNQNFISFDVSVIDFGPIRSLYSLRYNLHDFDEDWIDINPNSNEISYTGLPAGKYDLEIQLISSTGQILKSKRLTLVVAPPFHLKWYMILLYIILLGVIIFIVYRYIKKQRASRYLVEKTKREQKEADKINALKLDFFTYISHEFKTPLSIISTLQDDIFPSVDPNSEIEIDIFKRNIKRLEYLISQLMEFRSIESQHTPVRYSRHNIISFLRQISEAFEPLIKNKSIQFEFITQLNEYEMLIDSAKLEMLIGNLLSNSIKHTVYGGHVYLEIMQKEDALMVNVFNSGECLTEEQKQTIFEPYNKTYSSNIYANSGIGLAIVNSIAKLLNIELSIISIENEGNLFSVSIPILPLAGMDTVQKNIKTNIVQEIVDNTIYIEEQSLTNQDFGNSKYGYYLLMVENDNDTGKILKKKLEKHYQVIWVKKAKDALLIMKSQNVDLLISDVHMPDMNGYELCEAVKKNEKFKHIPIVLITSDIAPEAKIKGFQHGADAFIEKPVNIQELILRLDNILKSKRILREYYSVFKLKDEDSGYINNADEIFLKRASDYIYDNLNNVNLSVQKLANHSHVSRTQLYLNMKRLTHRTPSEFIVDIKMKEAKKMLASTALATSEIAYQLGYKNPNHFSRQFKEYTGKSPTKFKSDLVSDVSKPLCEETSLLP
ncbi:MAG: response regulator [Leadbetterella sp.]|nr:response regulator [Leadbetterella sp.]